MKVCFVALYALPVIDPSVQIPFGGIETRSVMLARELAKQPDFDVRFVVRHTHPRPTRTVDGMMVQVRSMTVLDRWRWFKNQSVRRLPHFPYLQVKRWNPALAWQLPLLAAFRPFLRPPVDPRQPDPFYTEIDADLFCCFGGNEHSATVVASAHAAGKPAALFLASDTDLNEKYATDDSYVSPLGERAPVSRFLIQEADLIVAQTARQQELLRERFGRDSIVLGNPIDLAMWTRTDPLPPVPPSLPQDRYVLWIGRADNHYKRPQEFLDLARLCPDLPCVMILNPWDDEIERQIRESAPPNVTLLDSLPFADMPALISHAAVFVSTSVVEGFPNTFLQAAALQVPIASLIVDPGFVAKSNCGVVCDGDVPRLAEFVRQVWQNPELGREYGNRGRAYVSEHHDLSHIVTQLADSLRNQHSGRTGNSF